MTKSEIISHIAKKAGVTNKVAGGVLDAFIGLINQTLKEEGEIRIDQLGKFKVVERKARTGVNPQTKAKIKIPARKAPTFRAAKALKDTVKGS
ncbi:MAG: HU family DNA-binding protein [Desulfomonile sp.]